MSRGDDTIRSLGCADPMRLGCAVPTGLQMVPARTHRFTVGYDVASLRDSGLEAIAQIDWPYPKAIRIPKLVHRAFTYFSKLLKSR
jgi:hypothetical protein